MIEIPLTQGKVALVDDEDFNFLNKHKWHAAKNDGNLYAMHSFRYRFRGSNPKVRCVRMHRLILKAPRGMVVDHIDGNGLNNQRSNLRICTNDENIRHQKPRVGATSRYKGVSWKNENSRWVSGISFNGKKNFLGYFVNEDDAARAYNEAASELHGEFALLNEIK